MKIWTRVVFDIETSAFLEGEWDEYTGRVAECKGAEYAQQQQQKELGMQTQAFQQQIQQLQSLQSQLSPYLGGTQGYNPQMMAAMQSQFLNNNAGQFQNAGQAVRQALLARGGGAGDMPVSGDYTRGISSLMGAAASSQAQGMLGLQQQNAQQALQNQFNAAQVLSGNAQTLTGTQGVAGSGSSNALQSFMTGKNIGFWPAFTQGFGGMLGKGLGTIATGGTVGTTGGG